MTSPNNENLKIGFYGGKFLPFHIGHAYAAIIPIVADRDEKMNSFSYSLEWDYKSIFFLHCNFIDKTWTKKNYYTLLNYLKCQYCPKNYTKLVDGSWIVFIKKT